MAIGGQLQLCKAGEHPAQKISTKDNYYTVLGLTNLTVHATMCVFILAGIERTPLVETGLELLVLKFGEVVDPHLFRDNSSPGYHFLGGSSCEF